MSDDQLYFVTTDGNAVLTAIARSNTEQDGMSAVDGATYDAARLLGVGRCTVRPGPAADDGSPTFAVAAYDPGTPAPTSVTGNQWAFALSNLGLSAAWLAGVMKSKASDQTRVNLIARDTALQQGDPLLARVCANAGQDASGKALIDPAAVFAYAVGMPK